MWKMKEKSTLFLIISTVSLLKCGAESMQLEGNTVDPIYWNSSNPLFSDQSPSGHRQVDAALNDKLDIICPHKMPDDKPGNLFYFKLYLVSEENFRLCNAEGGRRLLTCNIPNKEKKYTFFFQEISPSPWGLEFHPGKSYYVISTSDGSKKGIDERRGGVCTRYNMKLELRIHNSEVVPNSNDYPAKNDFPPYHFDDNEENNDPDYGANGGVIYEPEDNYPSKGGMSDPSPKDREPTDDVNGNGLIIGAVLGACAVLFIVLLAFLGYKVKRRRHLNKKYHSPPITPNGGPSSLPEVTLLPIAQATHNGLHHHHAHHTRLNSDRERLRSVTLSSHGEVRPPPSYNESFLENGGTVACV